MFVFKNRSHAGKLLAESLGRYANRPQAIVLGLPRGGLPVAYEVALALDADLDALIVRKLGHPDQEELAIGAIASGGIRVLNEQIYMDRPTLEEITQRELEELLRREKAYRGNRPYPVLQNRCVILVDDGLATGATMRAAVAAVRQQNPSRIVVAVPVAPSTTIKRLEKEADEVVCLVVPTIFYAIGQFYADFSQTTDDAVRHILQNAWERPSRTEQPKAALEQRP